MKRAVVAATAAVMVALLAGCSAPAVDEPVESAAPLVAESPADAAGLDADATYLADVRGRLETTTVIADATDDQLLAAGREACERMEAGEATEQMSVIEGEEPNGLGYFEDSAVIVSFAREHLC